MLKIAEITKIDKFPDLDIGTLIGYNLAHVHGYDVAHVTNFWPCIDIFSTHLICQSVR